MSETSLTQLRASLDRYLSRIVNTAKQASRMAFNSAGIIPEGTIKEWYGLATSSNGTWSLDISSAEFQQIMHIDPQAIYNDTSFSQQVTATLNTVSLTTVTGRVTRDGNKVGANCTIMLKVTGR